MRVLPRLVLVLALLSVSQARAEKVVVSGCGGGYDPIPALLPLRAGPLTLARVICLQLPFSSVPVSPPEPSPDQSSAFVFDSLQGLFITGTGSGTAHQRFNGRLTAADPFRGNLPFAWSQDSRSVFGVRQETAKPSGFALGPLSPFLFHVDGSQENLPELTSPSGPLDEIYWIGHSGMAIASFGTKGGYYRPEHPDPNPTIALVDARAGKVLQSFAIADVIGNGATSRIIDFASDRDGGSSLLTVAPDRWVLWVQGQPPRLVPIGLKPWLRPYALSPDGRSVLIMTNLTAHGAICEHNPRCPAPIPQSGVIAELHELPSGKVLWEVQGTATNLARSDAPAISPDGRLALIPRPDGTIALLSMSNGDLLQEIPRSGTAMGFAVDGRTIWVSQGARIAVYNLAN